LSIDIDRAAADADALADPLGRELDEPRQVTIRGEGPRGLELEASLRAGE
jgi:hypothetical protein